MRYFIGHVTRMDASLVITKALKLSTGVLSRDWKLPSRPPYVTLTLGYVHSTLEADLQPYYLLITPKQPNRHTHIQKNGKSSKHKRQENTKKSLYNRYSKCLPHRFLDKRY